MARRGAKRGQGRIFDDDVAAEIRRWYKTGLSYKSIARDYYCSISTVRDIVKKYGAYRRDRDV
jgi:DNA invertase Pin-like site-specific DNA recombinase